MHKKQKSFRKIYRRATTTQEHHKISLEVKIEYKHIKKKKITQKKSSFCLRPFYVNTISFR